MNNFNFLGKRFSKMSAVKAFNLGVKCANSYFGTTNTVGYDYNNVFLLLLDASLRIQKSSDPIDKAFERGFFEVLRNISNTEPSPGILGDLFE